MGIAPNMSFLVENLLFNATNHAAIGDIRMAYLSARKSGDIAAATGCRGFGLPMSYFVFCFYALLPKAEQDWEEFARDTRRIGQLTPMIGTCLSAAAHVRSNIFTIFFSSQKGKLAEFNHTKTLNLNQTSCTSRPTKDTAPKYPQIAHSVCGCFSPN